MKLVDALDVFLVAQKALGNSSRTQIWYRDQIRVFLRAVGEETPVSTVTAAQIRKFLADEQDAVSPSTVAARWRALSAWFNWLKGEDEAGLTASPLAKVPRPTAPRREPRRAMLEQVSQLVDAISLEDWRGHRDALIVRLMFWTGIRLSECAAIEVGHLDLRRRQVLIVGGKGDKDRRLRFPPELQPRIVEYLYRRPMTGVEGPLFPSTWRNGAVRVRDDGSVVAMTANGVAQAIRKRCHQAGIPPINPHAFRHGFAMAALNDGRIEMGILSKLLGHSDEQVTKAIYADWVTETIHTAYDEAVERMNRRSNSSA